MNEDCYDEDYYYYKDYYDEDIIQGDLTNILDKGEEDDKEFGDLEDEK